MKFNKSSLFLSSVLFSIFSVTANAYVNKDIAVVRIMNKAAGRAQTVNLSVGKTTEYEKLNLLVRSCKQTDPFDAENFFMFTEISKSDNKIFSGWMNRNEPGENPLQDADYDIWLVSCVNSIDVE